MSRFRKLSHSIWHCQYHIVWVPKYRFRILTSKIREACESGIQAICGFAGCEVVELNVQPDHVHLVVMIPPKLSISQLLGRLKGQTSMRLFNQFRYLKKKPYWGNHFWAKGYCVDTVGLDADMIRKYIQEILGHTMIKTTQRYSKLSNLKAQSDYFQAMELVMKNTEIKQQE